MMQADYDGDHYTRWRHERLSLISRYYPRYYFQGKTVLECGAAYGHIGRIFANSGATVTCTDQYEGWVDIITARHPMVQALQQDLIDPWPFTTPFDVIVSMGVLYHLPYTHAEQHIIDCCTNCNDLILETDTIAHEHPHVILDVPKPPIEHQWEPVTTNYCLPSVPYVERVLSANNFSFYRVPCGGGGRHLWFCKRCPS